MELTSWEREIVDSPRVSLSKYDTSTDLGAWRDAVTRLPVAEWELAYRRGAGSGEHQWKAHRDGLWANDLVTLHSLLTINGINGHVGLQLDSGEVLPANCVGCTHR